MASELLTLAELAARHHAHVSSLGVLVRANRLKPAGYRPFPDGGKGKLPAVYDAAAVAALVAARGGFRPRRMSLPTLTARQLEHVREIVRLRSPLRSVFFHRYPAEGRAARVHLSLDEIESDCLYAALVAATNYLPSKGTFEGWASLRMRATVNASVRQKRRLDCWPADEDGEPMTLLDAGADDPLLVAEAVDQAELRLPPFDAAVDIDWDTLERT